METSPLFFRNKLLEIKDNPDRKGEDRQNVSLVYLVEVGDKEANPDGEAEEVVWFDVDKLPAEEEWAFDHFEIVKKYLTDSKLS